MKPLSLLPFLCLFWISCHNRDRKFFDYDELIHYYNPISADDLVYTLGSDGYNSRLDSLKSEIIIGHIPKSIMDTAFIAELKEIGYTRKTISRSLFSKIDGVFSEKEASELSVTSCLHVYRDILVFKKHNWVTGMAKVCFECGAYQIEGAQGNTSNFGQDSDYKRLYKLLHNRELL